MGTIGQKIKKIRRDKNLTIKQLAERIGVTFQTISKWESDEVQPRGKRLEILAEALGISTSELFATEELKAPPGYIMMREKEWEAREREIQYLRKIAGLQEEVEKTKNIEVVPDKK